MSANRGGGRSGKPAAPAPSAAPEPAAIPAPEVVTPRANAWVTWKDTWGPKSLDFREDGQVAQWYVDFRASPASSWLIQRIQRTIQIEHTDGSPYPGAFALPWYPPTLDYYEAWWIDSDNKVRNPTSLTTAPESTEPSAWGDDLWNINTGSSRPTKGQRHEIRAEFFMVSALPTDFQFDAVRDAGVLPATTTAQTGLGPSIASREAVVTWDYGATPPTHEIVVA
jgi:hypothetical protein